MTTRRSTSKRVVTKKRAVATQHSPAKKHSPAKRGAAAKPKRQAVTSARRAAPKPGLRVAPRREVARAVATKPARRAPKPRPAPEPAFPQMLEGSAKEVLLFRMVRARASVAAAIQALDGAKANEPMAPGKWSARETVLHLVTRDRARLREMEAALRGIAPSWNGLEPARQGQVNELDMGPLRPLSWEEAVRLLHSTRQLLLEAVESVPDEPASVWEPTHPFGWMFQRLPDHDLHHADIIKRWRSERRT